MIGRPTFRPLQVRAQDANAGVASVSTVLMTRVREPLDSLPVILGDVAYRQVEHPAAYGSTFEEWVSRCPTWNELNAGDSKAAYLEVAQTDSSRR